MASVLARSWALARTRAATTASMGLVRGTWAGATVPSRTIAAGRVASRLSARAFFLVGASLFGFSAATRHYYDELMRREDFRKKVHKDESQARIRVRRQVQDKVSLVYKDEDGERKAVLVDAHKYTAFVREQIHELNDSRGALLSLAEASLDQHLDPVFQRFEKRLDRFADWYFSYSTTYKLLAKAASSLVRRSVSVLPSGLSVTDAVAADMVKYLQKQYESIVLRPEVSDAQLQEAYVDSLRDAHEQYRTLVGRTNARFQEFVAENTTHLKEPKSKDVTLTLDWASQLNKVNTIAATHEKGLDGAAVGIALVTGGAVIGKAAMGAATAKGGAVAAGKGIAGKTVMGKLAAPFVGKAAASAGATAGAGAAGTALGGPLGGLVGALAGLGIDYTINAGVELMQRDEFVADMREALNATRQQWKQNLMPELQRVVNVWVDDAIQLLADFDVAEKKRR